MISVVILTLNESTDLPGCLDALHWCDDIHILDSGSTDKTLSIGSARGVSIAVHPFEGFGVQRNYALDNLDLKYDWVLFLDADEHATEKFAAEVLHATATAEDGVAGFYCCSKLMLEGRWLKRSDTFPKWQFRLLKKGKARFKNLGHGQKECEIQGTLGYIKEGYLHFGISKGWTKWIERHNRYSAMEAATRLYECPPLRNVLLPHASLRNAALKCWLSRIPLWPWLRFFHAYFFNLGFLEGTQGLLYCINNFYYEFMVTLKMRELQINDKQKKKTEAPVLHLTKQRIAADVISNGNVAKH